MTQSGKPWVGDVVRDKVADKVCVISDVQSGVYVLRPVWGTGEWITESVDDLTLVVPREDRQHHQFPSER